MGGFELVTILRMKFVRLFFFCFNPFYNIFFGEVVNQKKKEKDFQKKAKKEKREMDDLENNFGWNFNGRTRRRVTSLTYEEMADNLEEAEENRRRKKARREAKNEKRMLREDPEFVLMHAKVLRNRISSGENLLREEIQRNNVSRGYISVIEQKYENFVRNSKVGDCMEVFPTNEKNLSLSISLAERHRLQVKVEKQIPYKWKRKAGGEKLVLMKSPSSTIPSSVLECVKDVNEGGVYFYNKRYQPEEDGILFETISRKNMEEFEKISAAIEHNKEREIPADILRVIFSYINDFFDILSISQVCKKWRRIVTQNRTLKQIQAL